MRSGARRTVRPLAVRRRFEPSRIAAACLAAAYEQVVPIVRRPIRADRPRDGADHVNPARREGGHTL
jgi:hypothetical protein